MRCSWLHHIVIVSVAVNRTLHGHANIEISRV